ncbi:MAG: NAD(P)H-binding protein [Solirubrobacterales bacterium]|nr:NAD(P)H-binding protein [Solirubrobacterales bacterium]
MRVLLVGGGCRGLVLTRALVADGHAVRVVTRTDARRAAIEDAGGEVWIGDPDVIGSLRYAMENVTILVWALGTASGTPDAVAALHGPRLEMMLSKVIDTTIRGVVYEAGGTIAPAAFATGIAELERMGQLNEIPVAIMDADPGDEPGWAAAAREAIGGMVGIGYDQIT